MANLGDSRAIIISKDPNDSTECIAKQITRDHKPDDPLENKNILAAGGRVDSYRDASGRKVGPERVWLKNEDVPGLAMSRSFGDQTATRAGVTSIPEVSTLQLQPNDRVVILASDGVWEFLTNKKVADTVYPFYLMKNAEGAAETLVKAAHKSWKNNESVVDDITCIVIFLDVKNNQGSMFLTEK